MPSSASTYSKPFRTGCGYREKNHAKNEKPFSIVNNSKTIDHNFKKQRQRNRRGRYTRELGRLDFSENRNMSKKVGQSQKNVNILSRKSRGNKKRLYVRLKWKRKNHFLPTKDIANRKTDCTKR